MDGGRAGSAADALDPGGVSAGNAVSGISGVPVISDALGVGAGNTTNSGVGTASFVPKTNSSIAARVVCLTG